MSNTPNNESGKPNMIDPNDPRLTAYVLGELKSAEAAEIENAIQSSPELAAAVQEIRAMTGSLSDAYQAEPQLSLSGEQKEALGAKNTPATKSSFAGFRRWLAVAVAACLAAIIFGGPWLIDRVNSNWKPSRSVAHSPDREGWTHYTPLLDDIDELAPSEIVPRDYEIVESYSRRPMFGEQTKSTGTDLPLSIAKSLEVHDRNPEDLSASDSLEPAVPRPALVAPEFGPSLQQGQRLQNQQQEGELSEGMASVNRSTTSPRLRGLSGRTPAGGKDEDSDRLERRRLEEREKVSEAQQHANLFSRGRKIEKQLMPRMPEKGVNSGKRLDSNITRGARTELQKENQELFKPKLKSWKRVKAIPNTTRLMVGDKEELALGGMQVNAQVDGFRARVLVDYFYYNDRENQLEGNFKLRLPDDASLYYFAFGESAYEFSPEGKLANEEFLRDGTQFVSLSAPNVKETRKGQWDNVKEARMVPKEKAAHAFRETVRRRVDPALVEWSGAGVFSAKVFPLAPKKLHRIVVGYDVNLTRSDDGMTFALTLPEQTGQCRVEVNVPEIDGVTYAATPTVDPIARARNGQLQKRFVFDNDQAELSSIELKIAGTDSLVLTTPVEKTVRIKKAKPDSDPQEGNAAPANADDSGDGFWTMQVTPDLPSESADANARAIFLVDTSLSTDPGKFNVWVNMLEATLNNNRDSLKEFDVLFFNVDGHFWNGKYVANTQANVDELKNVLGGLALEGATDLYAAIETVTNADWIDEQKSPDLFLLSDGAATWGETDLRMINELLQQPQCGSLFAYQTGLSGTAISNLRFLAGQSGGAVFSVANEDEVKTASTAHRQRPWKLKSIVADGATDILTAGRIEWFYPGQTVTVVGRGKIENKVDLTFAQGDESKTVTAEPTSIESELASRMYGHVAVGQLESLGSKVVKVATAYARHFRITGQTCSLLMLESEEDYLRFDIKPQEDLFVVKAKAAGALVEETLAKHAETLADPKARLRGWLGRLEAMPGMEFKMPTALELAFDDIQVEAISNPLSCQLTTKEPLADSYLKSISQQQLDYETIAAEALLRKQQSVDDSLKVYSSLVERNPGDITVARDVAFTALELKRPAAAFHLLRRVAEARPFQGNIYPAIGQCLTQLGKADMAIVYYEIAINGTFKRQGKEFKRIVAAEYSYLLRQIVSGKLESSVKDFAKARLETLSKHLPSGTADVVVTLMWNQDQTDVDLHVIEPSGEECFYSHRDTRSGGHMTSDITTGFGPEMYFLPDAPRGKYQVKAKFYRSNQNRTSTRNKVYVTVFEGFGTDDESMTRQTIQLQTVGKVVPVLTLGVE